MKLAVIGSGLMGRAALYDLARADQVDGVGIFDIDEDLARETARKYGNDKAVYGRLDASDENAAAEILKDYDAAVSCVTYRLNPTLTRAAIRGRCHMVDLGGNNDTVQEQIDMNDEAEKAGVIIVPDCGLAPGMVSVMVADGVSRLDTADSAHIRVGGLPQSPRPPLNYMMVFSSEGLINEYWEPCVAIKDGKKQLINPMSEIEELEFDGVGKLEAFTTSGGTSTLPETMAGKVTNLDYKTIRYPGHCEMVRPMLEIGLASRQPVQIGDQKVEPRAVLKAVFEKTLSYGDLDMVLLRVTCEGTKDGQPRKVVYELLDRQDSHSGLTAMMRTTAFPAAIVAWMAAVGQIEARGVKPQELVVKPALFLPQLKKRGLNLSIVES